MNCSHTCILPATRFVLLSDCCHTLTNSQFYFISAKCEHYWTLEEIMRLVVPSVVVCVSIIVCVCTYLCCAVSP